MMRLKDFNWGVIGTYLAISLAISLTLIVLLCGWFIFQTFVYGCNFETKTVCDFVVLGDLRIEKTEYWSGCWKDYWEEEEGYYVRRYGYYTDTVETIVLQIPTLKDSLICDKCDSTVYNFFTNDTYQLAVSIVDHGKSKSEGNYERGTLNSSLHSWSYGLIPREYADTTLEVTESKPRVGQWVW